MCNTVLRVINIICRILYRDFINMVIAFFCVLGYLMPYLCKITPSRPTRMYSFSRLCIRIDGIFINSDAEESIITRGEGRTYHFP